MNRIIALLAASAIFLACGGCRVLTDQQVDAVKKFSTATENYGQLPGEVIRDYRDVTYLRREIKFTMAKGTDGATKLFDEALAQRAKLSTDADRADIALRILDDYSRMLSLLVSDNYSLELNASVSSSPW